MLSFEEIAASQEAAGKMLKACGITFTAIVSAVDWYRREMIECEVSITKGYYATDHNMYHIFIDWPEDCMIPDNFGLHYDYDCGYCKMKFVEPDGLTIYDGDARIEIDLLKRKKRNKMK